MRNEFNTPEQFNMNHVRAYVAGYYDGRANGWENNDFMLDMERHMYKLGYDAGVTDYCNDIGSEED